MSSRQWKQDANLSNANWPIRTREVTVEAGIERGVVVTGVDGVATDVALAVSFAKQFKTIYEGWDKTNKLL